MLGVYWKIQDICYHMGTEIFKIEEKMTEKMKPHVAKPPSENGQNSLCILDEFEGSYGYFSKKQHFFETPCTVQNFYI